MTNKQLQEMLEKAYKADFLNSIMILKNNEKDYEKTDFYKATKIKLSELYKMFFQFKGRKNTLLEQIDELILNFDSGAFVEKVQDVLIELEENETFGSILEEITKKFDSSQIEGYLTEMKEAFAKIQKN